MKRFGALLKEGRARKQMTAGELAKQVGIGASVLSEMETGKRTTAPEQLWVRRFSQILGISPVRLLIALGFLEEGDFEDTPVSDAASELLEVINDYEWGEYELILAERMLRTIGETHRGAYIPPSEVPKVEE